MKPVFTMNLLVLLFFASDLVWAKTIRYELNIDRSSFNVTGKAVDFAIMVNGAIPAPTLEFTEGDDAEITVNNKLSDEEASVHWHGILLPPEEDGVAYVNTPPIGPGTSRTFKFKIRQHGTYWYHSHTMFQEQKGVYGALVIHPKKPIIAYDKSAVVVISDWTDENPDEVIRNLKKDGDYYLYKKNSVRSIGGAIEAGEIATYFKNEWERMGGMDLSDVGYDAFLINGKRDAQLLTAHPGERVRLRIINAGASSYFYVSLGNVPMQVISADGIDIEPIQAKEILIGMAETYDVLFTVPEHNNFELRATAQDVTGHASAWIGMGPKVPVPDKPKPNLYAPMDHGGGQVDHSAHSGHAVHPDHQAHSDHSAHGASASKPAVPLVSDVDLLTVDDLKAKEATTLPKGAKVQSLKLVLDGDMERYVWHINGKAMHEDRNIIVKEGDAVQFVFENKSMMHHPMHLHGHFFRVINKNGERSPLKHTVDVPPHGTRVIEFHANEPGQWMLHCHNLFHMKTGMGRVVKYLSFKPSPEISRLESHDPHLHDHWYKSGSLVAATNIAEGRFRVSNTWNEIIGKVEVKKDDEWEGEGDLFYRRWFDNYFSLIAGGSAVHDDYRGELGIGYILPMLIESKVLIDHKGKFRVDLEKRFQWTSAVFTEAEYVWREDGNLESDYSISLMYGPSWGFAMGLKYTGSSFGAGFQYRF